jgi:DNA-directed RNA polymerase subunit N (RpoN/RPB10)
MGVLVRCDSCGEVRWSILAAADHPEDGRCDACGKPLSVERRRPGRRLVKREGHERHERRDFHPLIGPPA